MTTAHRPTWAPAKGHEEQGGMRILAPSRQVSAKNLPGHLKLKFRQEGQGSVAEVLKKDLRAELEEKELKHFAKKQNNDFDEKRKKDLLLLEAAPAASTRTLVPRAIDADDVDPDDANDASDDDEEDDEEEDRLLRLELERIKKERAEEAAKRAEEEAKREAEAKREEAMRSNPLLAAGGAVASDVSFGIKKRWYEDVVFRNQSRGEPKAQKRFINDTIRSDFHRRFLDKYVR